MSEFTIDAVQPAGLLKAIEVARRLNISKALAYRLLQQGEIPCVRIGTAVRVSPEDLVKYIQANLTGIQE